ncbi:hypothetical protein NDU88_001641 [Pleurodeles waltl]|uniref:Uncharacterized protein n=1 Tax=Pleurodeles waltl TaxID=8319 RepID=A0AAV7NEU9_PLEWA|nr:hypothetical protein NDU88_001641 [Pleurodeles waltl]
MVRHCASSSEHPHQPPPALQVHPAELTSIMRWFVSVLWLSTLGFRPTGLLLAFRSVSQWWWWGNPQLCSTPTPQLVSRSSLTVCHSSWPVPFVRLAAGQCLQPGPRPPGTSLLLEPTSPRCTLQAARRYCRVVPTVILSMPPTGLLSHVSTRGSPTQAWSPCFAAALSVGPPSSPLGGSQHGSLQVCPSDLLSSTAVESLHGEHRPHRRSPVQGPLSSRGRPAQAAPAAARAELPSRTPPQALSVGPQAIWGTRGASTRPPDVYSHAQAGTLPHPVAELRQDTPTRWPSWPHPVSDHLKQHLTV